MNDTHGVEGEGWYGFDLDGTLAVYDKWEGIDHIGEPVKPMVDLIKRMHAKGEIVKILTARVAPRADPEYVDRETCEPPDYVPKSGYADLSPGENMWVRTMYLGMNQWGAKEFIADWCLRNLGFLPKITHEKDHLMLELYDDRVKQVIPNRGVLMEDVAACEAREIARLENSYMVRFGSFTNGFIAGLLAAIAITFGVNLVWGLCHRTPADKALDNLRSAIIEVQEALR